MMIYSALIVAIGAALGALIRWLLGLGMNHLLPAIPPGTIAANLLGAYLIGIAMAVFGHVPTIPPEWRLFVMTGFLGGLTTFSAFSAEIVTLLQQQRLIWAAVATTVHVGGSLLMTLLGLGTVYGLTSLFK